MSMIRSGIVVAGFTLLSRIFGYIRDVLIASYIGVGPVADAFAVAFKLPNFFRTIFAEGAFSAAFVPIFSSKILSSKEDALKFASQVFIILFISLLIFISIFEIFMPYVMYILAPGFVSDPQTYQIAVELSYITMPYLLFISIASLYVGILNSYGHFAAGAALPVILSLSMIICLLTFKHIFQTPAHSLAIGIFFAGLLQLAMIIIFAKFSGIILYISKPKISEDLRKLFKNMIPVIIGSGVTQLNLWIDTIIATSITGAVSAIYYAERLNQFPLAIIGTSIGTILLPNLSKQLREKKFDEANITSNRALEISLFFTLPCAFALMILAFPIISILFERNAFTREDSVKVANILKILSCGLPAFVMIKIVTSRYFAMHDTKTPVRISILCLILNVVFSLLLIQYYSYLGIAISTSLTAWINVSLLLYFLIKNNFLLLDNKLKINTLKIIISCIIMTIIIYVLNRYFMVYFSKFDVIKPLFLMIVIIISGSSYLLIAYFLNIYRRIDSGKI